MGQPTSLQQPPVEDTTAPDSAMHAEPEEAGSLSVPGEEKPQQTGDVTTFRSLLAESTPRFFVTPIILALNVAIFGAMVLSGVSLVSPQLEHLLDWGASFGPLILSGEWWRLFSAMFVHIGILHLALNMQCLWRLGNLAERLFGNWPFLVLYVLSGLGGGVASVWWHPDIVSAGASGAIFGLAGGLVVFLYRGRLPVPQKVIQPTLTSTLFFIAYNLLYGFAQSGIDNIAHLGGLLTGAAIGGLLVRSLPRTETRLRLGRFLGITGTMLLLLLGTILVKGRDPVVGLVRAEKLLEAGKLDQAISEIESALERDPNLATGHFLLGNVHLQKELYEEAIPSYTQAISLDPQFAGAYFNRGLAYALTAQYDDALTDFDKAIELEPDDAQAFFLRGLVYADLEERESAISDLEKALALGLEPEGAENAKSVLQDLTE
jgi:membrane associated rhomboid family serine protease